MNHIARLTQDRNEAAAKLKAVQEELIALEAYLTSSKFQGPDNDYVHVRTDLLPKLSTIRMMTLEG